MSDAVTKRAGAKKIYDTRIANKLIADILVVSDSFSARNPQAVAKLAEGWLEGVEFIRGNPTRAYNLIGTIKDFNIPSDLAKTMLEGVRLADYAENVAFFGSGAESDYDNVFRMAGQMYREERMIKHVADPESSVDRRYLGNMKGRFSAASSEPAPVYSAPAAGAKPIGTQHRSIYFEPNSAKMSLDSRAIVEEVADFMRAYENTVIDIEGNTDSTGSRALNTKLSWDRAEAVKQYLVAKGYPAERMRTVGRGPDSPIETNATPEGREKNRRTDIKWYANPAK
jgi:outer membrane protein OmpA-like peptidoglycan-associated protein